MHRNDIMDSSALRKSIKGVGTLNSHYLGSDDSR